MGSSGCFAWLVLLLFLATWVYVQQRCSSRRSEGLTVRHNAWDPPPPPGVIFRPDATPPYSVVPSGPDFPRRMGLTGIFGA